MVSLLKCYKKPLHPSPQLPNFVPMLHKPLSKLNLIMMEQDQPQSNLKPYNNNNNNNNTSSKKISISILVISLPVLYVSLSHVPFSCLFKDTTFWFLISNSIIILVAADSGLFAGSSSSMSSENLYDEYVKHSRARSLCFVSVPPPPPPILVKEEKIEEAEQIQEPPPANVDEKQSLKGSNEIDSLTNGKQSSTELTVQEPVVLISEKEIVAEQPRYDRSRSELPEKSRVSATVTKNLVPRSATMVTEKRSCSMEESEYWKMSDEELNKRVEEFIRSFNREIRLQGKMSTVY